METRHEDDGNDEDIELWKAALDDDSFDKISEADLGFPSHPAAKSMGVDSSEQQEQRQEGQGTGRRARHGASTSSTTDTASATTQRFKRKNFSKQLQLLCLERYAHYARDVGRLPDKQGTQQILQQSYVQFLKQGGTAAEPRLTHAEFLKLIRNRRREIHARAQRVPLLLNKDEQVTAKAIAALTPAKRKLQEEHAKIQEFINIIDRTRKRAGLVLDPQQHQQQRQRLRAQPSVVGIDTCAQQRQPQPLATRTDVTESSPSVMKRLPLLLLDPMEQVETILQIFKETQDVQREIAETLRTISRVISQHEGHGDVEEPSSASV